MTYLALAKEALAKRELEQPSAGPTPPIPPPPDNPMAEAERVPRIVREKGVCLLWAEAVKDYVAFALNDEEARKVPPGYTVYTLDELTALYGPGRRAPTLAQLRMIHEAMKLGGKAVREKEAHG